MKLKVILPLFLTCAVIVAAGCRKDKTGYTASADITKLHGSWNWVQSLGGFSGETLTPASEGYTIVVEFIPNGFFRQYKNGHLEKHVGYNLVRDSIFGRVENILIRDGNQIRQRAVFGGQDSLFLDDECEDCYRHVYVRQ